MLCCFGAFPIRGALPAFDCRSRYTIEFDIRAGQSSHRPVLSHKAPGEPRSRLFSSRAALAESAQVRRLALVGRQSSRSNAEACRRLLSRRPLLTSQPRCLHPPTASSRSRSLPPIGKSTMPSRAPQHHHRQGALPLASPAAPAPLSRPTPALL